MAEANCVICGSPVKGLFKKRCRDGCICKQCLAKCTPHVKENLRNMSVQAIKKNMTVQTEMLRRKQEFKRTRKINDLEIDEDHQLWHIKDLDNIGLYYSYADIIDFDVVKDNSQIIESHTETHDSGGLTRAVIGGALFGATGAIIGATTGGSKSSTVNTVKDAVDDLSVRIRVNDDVRPVARIRLISAQTATDSFTYIAAMKDAAEITKALTGMVEASKRK